MQARTTFFSFLLPLPAVYFTLLHYSPFYKHGQTSVAWAWHGQEDRRRRAGRICLCLQRLQLAKTSAFTSAASGTGKGEENTSLGLCPALWQQRAHCCIVCGTFCNSALPHHRPHTYQFSHSLPSVSDTALTGRRRLKRRQNN